MHRWRTWTNKEPLSSNYDRFKILSYIRMIRIEMINMMGMMASSTSKIENKTRKNNLFFSARMQRLSQNQLPDLADSQLAALSSLGLMRFISILPKRLTHVVCLTLTRFTWLYGNNPRNTRVGQSLHICISNPDESRRPASSRVSTAFFAVAFAWRVYNA